MPVVELQMTKRQEWGEEHNEASYAVKDQRFLGEVGFGEEISGEVEEKSAPKTKKPIETVFKEIARRVEATPALLRSRDRRWDISHKRAEAVLILVREYGYGVSEVAKYLGRDGGRRPIFALRQRRRLRQPLPDALRKRRIFVCGVGVRIDVRKCF